MDKVSVRHEDNLRHGHCVKYEQSLRQVTESKVQLQSL